MSRLATSIALAASLCTWGCGEDHSKHVAEAPSPALAPARGGDEAFVQPAVAPREPRTEVDAESLRAVLDQVGDSRAAALQSLVERGWLSPEAASLLPASRATLMARARALLRRRGHNPDELCEDDLNVEPSTGDVVELHSNGDRCADGAWLETRFRLGREGLSLVSVRRRRNN